MVADKNWWSLEQAVLDTKENMAAAIGLRSRRLSSLHVGGHVGNFLESRTAVC